MRKNRERTCERGETFVGVQSLFTKKHSLEKVYCNGTIYPKHEGDPKSKKANNHDQILVNFSDMLVFQRAISKMTDAFS